MNDKLISMFKNLALYEESLGRHFPSKAYLNAVASLKDFDTDITDVKQLDGIFGFGKGLKEKVDLFLKTGTFPRYEEFLNSDFYKTIEMSKIKGIGVNKAKKLAAGGIHSLDELKKVTENLKVNDMIGETGIRFINSMKVGLDFEAHTDKTRMTINQHDEIAAPIINDLHNKFNNIKVSFAGSRRRWNGINMEYTVGDIDIIIGVPDEEYKGFHKNLPQYLDRVVMNGTTKVSGIKNSRQIDFRIVKIENYESLLLHATGPMKFNIKCRKAAMSRNMILNEYGLFNRTTNELIDSTEVGILKNLFGIYYAPDERDLVK